MSVQACADLVARGDEDRFRATMAAPVAAREVLFPIHAFCLEVARAPWVTKEAIIAEMRLQWWRDVLGEIAGGKPPRAHEVAAPLSAALTPWAAEALDVAVTARQWDIYRDPHDDAEALARYLQQSYAVPMTVAARLLGAPEAASDGLMDLGYAGALARYFIAVPGLEAAGRVPLVDGRPEAVQALAEAALAGVRAVRATVAALPAEARAPMIDALTLLPVLKQAARDPMAVAEGRLGQGALGKAVRLTLASQAPGWACR